ncbi:glycoside hydrolase family 9 protein [Phyllobacterium sp. YR531]|uniref:glycoside hydrolase family 9 protein n=1 Tax=Phyllobacterium sp. YR531 TaxID=1144343 RepID=UPI00026F9880|nr:glycoside hydrolase family 9 protein [Phyllobacterium sp. YR531]EJN05358.1 glycosyl hydrolase family 9 [Phyllobacterium sp. YR531]
MIHRCLLMLLAAISIHTVPTVALSAETSVRVNQLGYLPDGPKFATIVSSSDKPLKFQLTDAKGVSVLKGVTKVLGVDAMSGLKTQKADFSIYQKPGENYRLAIGGSSSSPFSISASIYDRLSLDTQSWFYLARSGIEIREDIAGKAYARPAGHVGVAPNLGDTSVPCLDNETAAKIYTSFKWQCSYTLDVSGGWYDAGDQGKYVVNAGIAVSQLVDTVERGRLFASNAANVLSDQRSRLPEQGNGVPDILDEARWELEFMLKMVVPEGQPFAGMVHHKVHDTAWTGLPMLPHNDPQPRALYAPSTAATLNLAAAAAQGARLFKDYDDQFAARLLTSAKQAWSAAQTHPDIIAPSGNFDGGGAYGDGDLSDEFYWAATELYLATSDETYLSGIKNSPYWDGDVFSRGGHGAFDWANTAGLARLHLALYGRKLLAPKDWEIVKTSVVSAAERFIRLQQKEPFGQIYRPDNGKYDWGSNHSLLQNMIVVSAAYDLTKRPEFLTSVRESMDYLLGRNAINTSYITGYGTSFSKNQHSRWFARQADQSLPNPPFGSLAGGPNSSLVDDFSKAKLAGCAPQQCYFDNIEAYGSNEITINWNAPLVYMANFIDNTRVK